jgi:hypothetical protein
VIGFTTLVLSLQATRQSHSSGPKENVTGYSASSNVVGACVTLAFVFIGVLCMSQVFMAIVCRHINCTFSDHSLRGMLMRLCTWFNSQILFHRLRMKRDWCNIAAATRVQALVYKRLHGSFFVSTLDCMLALPGSKRRFSRYTFMPT